MYDEAELLNAVEEVLWEWSISGKANDPLDPSLNRLYEVFHGYIKICNSDLGRFEEDAIDN